MIPGVSPRDYAPASGVRPFQGAEAGAIGKRYSLPACCLTGGPRPSSSWWTLPQVTVTMGGLDNRIGFAGYWYDPHLKMYHVRHRVYDPVDARGLQRDPIRYAGGWNLYQYCNGGSAGDGGSVGAGTFELETTLRVLHSAWWSC